MGRLAARRSTSCKIDNSIWIVFVCDFWFFKIATSLICQKRKNATFFRKSLPRRSQEVPRGHKYIPGYLWPPFTSSKNIGTIWTRLYRNMQWFSCKRSCRYLKIKGGNLRWASGVIFVVTSVHFWKNHPILWNLVLSVRLILKMSLDTLFVVRKCFAATLRTIKVEHVDKKIIQQRKWSWIQSCSKSCWFWWSHF